MKTNTLTKQYTIRGITATVDKALQKIAKEEDKSLNHVVIDALTEVAATVNGKKKYDDLDSLIGGWQEDAEFSATIKEQSKIEKDLWK